MSEPSGRTGSIQIAHGNGAAFEDDTKVLKIGELFIDTTNSARPILKVALADNISPSETVEIFAKSSDVSIDTDNYQIQVGDDILNTIFYARSAEKAAADSDGDSFSNYLKKLEASSTYVNKNTESTIVKNISRSSKLGTDKDSLSITKISGTEYNVNLPTTYWGTTSPESASLTGVSVGDMYIKYDN